MSLFLGLISVPLIYFSNPCTVSLCPSFCSFKITLNVSCVSEFDRIEKELGDGPLGTTGGYLD